MLKRSSVTSKIKNCNKFLNMCAIKFILARCVPLDFDKSLRFFWICIAWNTSVHEGIALPEKQIIDQFWLTIRAVSNSNEGDDWALIFIYICSFVKYCVSVWSLGIPSKLCTQVWINKHLSWWKNEWSGKSTTQQVFRQNLPYRGIRCIVQITQNI